MDKFKGTFDNLKQFVASAELSGEWREIEHGYQFRAEDGAILNWYPTKGSLTYGGPPEARNAIAKRLSQKAVSAVPAEVASAREGERPRVFVVHGHDQVACEQLELILHKLGLEPFVLASTGGGGLTLMEALEREVIEPRTRARFGIVLMTPDDMGYAKRDGELAVQPRARQNVVLEMGMLIAALSRPNVVILKKGHLEIPSDANGIIYLGFNEHVKETVPKLVDRLRNAGFVLAPDAITRVAS